MFNEFFGASAEQVNESNKAHAVNVMSVTILLLEKGIFTEEEYNRARNQATHFVDQAWAEKRSEAVKQFDEEHPGVRSLLGRIGFPNKGKDDHDSE